MPQLSLLIKPSSSACNLKCKYCFYHDVSEKREVQFYGYMSIETLEKIVKKSLEFADETCTFGFQGGEPTLLGLEFFKKLIEFEKKYNLKGVKINNIMQTNGIVIDEEWAKFLHENNFLIGLSLDGYEDIHNLYRVYGDGKGSFDKVMNTVDLFNKFGVEYNILCVVTAQVARNIKKIYSFYKRKGLKYLQFIPCLDPLEEKLCENKYSLTNEKYAYFLKTLFDLWYEDNIKGDFVSIRYFDNLINMALGYVPELCGMMGICGCQFVVEGDGSVYPCDFYVTDEWYLGNLKEKSFEELRFSKPATEFIEESKRLNPECKKCDYFYFCRGGCKRQRIENNLNDKIYSNYFCDAYKEFFKYSLPKIKKLVDKFNSKM